MQNEEYEANENIMDQNESENDDLDEVVKENAGTKGKCIRNNFNKIYPATQRIILEAFGCVDTYIANIQNVELADRYIEAITDIRREEDQRALLLRYGLIDGKVKSLEEVAYRMGMTIERVRRLDSKVLRPRVCACYLVSRTKNMADYLND